MPYLSKFCSIAVQAYIKFPDKMKIKKYTSKIINFYITEKIRFTQAHFKDL
jgi:acyl-ACP thioesterase